VEAQDSAATTATYNNRNELTQQSAGATLPVAGTLSEPATVSVSGAPASVDAANRFAGQTTLGAGTQTFTVVATDPSGNTRTNTYQVNVTGTARTFTYDPNGNLASKTEGGVTTTYDWDAENRLVAIKQGGNTIASFTYDGGGRRTQKTAGGATHTYVYDHAKVIEEAVSTGQTLDFVHGPGIDRPLAQRDQAGAASYYLADHLRSVVQITNATGAIILSREYDPWGNLLQGIAVPGFAFTGREWDPETGLYYYRARYYDPKVGRFVSEDPLGVQQRRARRS
jgi:RHS repeat-associated protein